METKQTFEEWLDDELDKDEVEDDNEDEKQLRVPC